MKLVINRNAVGEGRLVRAKVEFEWGAVKQFAFHIQEEPDGSLRMFISPTPIVTIVDELD